MGQYADDAIHEGLDQSWGWRPRGWDRQYVSQQPATPAIAEDFDDLTAGTAEDLFWRAAENYAEAYREYWKYMCEDSFADLEKAIAALEAAR